MNSRRSSSNACPTRPRRAAARRRPHRPGRSARPRLRPCPRRQRCEAARRRATAHTARRLAQRLRRRARAGSAARRRPRRLSPAFGAAVDSAEDRWTALARSDLVAIYEALARGGPMNWPLAWRAPCWLWFCPARSPPRETRRGSRFSRSLSRSAPGPCDRLGVACRGGRRRRGRPHREPRGAGGPDRRARRGDEPIPALRNSSRRGAGAARRSRRPCHARRPPPDLYRAASARALSSPCGVRCRVRRSYRQRRNGGDVSRRVQPRLMSALGCADHEQH